MGPAAIVEPCMVELVDAKAPEPSLDESLPAPLLSFSGPGGVGDGEDTGEDVDMRRAREFDGWLLLDAAIGCCF